MKRFSTVGFAALVVLPWALGFFGTLETPQGFGAGRVVWAALVEVVTGLAALAVAAAVTGRIRVRYAWLGIVVAVTALIVGRLHQGVPVWPAGACCVRPGGRTGRRWRRHWTRSGSPTGPVTRCPRSPAASSSAP